MPGFGGLTLSRCLERPGRYLLLVEWDAARGPHRGLPRLAGLPGVAGAAALLLRPVPGRRALRDRPRGRSGRRPRDRAEDTRRAGRDARGRSRRGRHAGRRAGDRGARASGSRSWTRWRATSWPTPGPARRSSGTPRWRPRRRSPAWSACRSTTSRCTASRRPTCCDDGDLLSVDAGADPRRLGRATPRSPFPVGTPRAGGPRAGRHGRAGAGGRHRGGRRRQPGR